MISAAYERSGNTLEIGMDDALTGAIMSNQDTQRAIEILAKSVYRDLKQNGYSRADVLAFASNILEQVTSEAKAQQQTEARDSV
jgi:hypothetical protein